MYNHPKRRRFVFVSCILLLFISIISCFLLYPRFARAELSSSRTWMRIQGGPHNALGHAYANEKVAGPITVLAENARVKAGESISLTLVPENSNNFGIFYGFVDDSNWIYIGYDSQSHWYMQYQDGTRSDWPAFAGALPEPVDDVPLDISIAIDREAISLTVNGVQSRMSNKVAGDLATRISSNARVGVMTKAQTAVKFTDFCVGEKNIMEDVWELAATRDGQIFTTEKVALYTLSGKVVGPDGNALSGATVRVGTLSATSSDDGQWSISGVEEGKQLFTASKVGYLSTEQEVEVNEDSAATSLMLTLQPKPELNLDGYKTISSDLMKVYVSPTFPVPARYEMLGESLKGAFFRGEEGSVSSFRINGVETVPTVDTVTIEGSRAFYVLHVSQSGVVADITVEMEVVGRTLVWRVTHIDKHPNSAPISSLNFSNIALLSIDAADGGQGFAGAHRSTHVNKTGDEYISFDSGFIPNSSSAYLYGFLSTDKLSAGIFSNSEAEGDKRITRTNTADTIRLSSSVFYVERGDASAQNYATANNVTFPSSELPEAKIAISLGDENSDKTVDWNDGAIATREILNTPQGSENIKKLVNYRVVMNFGSEVTNPFTLTADNMKKVALATDGLPQALLLKGYGNEGHDSANSEYADISIKEGGVKGFQDLIKLAHQYNTEIGIHINAQEAYPESKSFNDRMIQNQGNGWGWLDQSTVIDKLWDLGSNARWARLVQLYDRINGTSFVNKNWDKGDYIGDPAQSGATVAPLSQILADVANRPDNMDFIYLDVWYQDSWETRRIAEQINQLGWRFSTEFPNEGEYDSTWSHWATDAPYGGLETKGLNSDIIRFLRNDQRDISPNNSSDKGGVMNNPLLGGYYLTGFEGWSGQQDYNNYIRVTFRENLPTRFLQHYQIIDWENYAEGDYPVKNLEKEIVLTNDDDARVVVSRHEKQRSDDVIEREISLDGRIVLNDGAYLLPWIDDFTGEEKLYHFNVDGGTTTWELPEKWSNKEVTVWRLSDQGRVDPQNITTSHHITLNAESNVAYVIVPKGSENPLSVDTIKFGENTPVIDPGFNSYAAGDKLDSKVWSGDIDSSAVSITRNTFGDQFLNIDSPTQDIVVSTTLSNLVPGCSYVAEVYVSNESDADTIVQVTSGDAVSYRRFGRSYAGNWTTSDAKHGTQNKPSKMTRVYVAFKANASEAVFSIRRAAGEGATQVDNIRVIAAEDFPMQAADGSFTQDFEHAVSGLYPFIAGSPYKSGDAVAHLSERHDPYTQTGWKNKQIDDVLEGNWSLKHHDGRAGLLLRTAPQTVYFEPGVRYRVEIDYQVGPEGVYFLMEGSGEEKWSDKNYVQMTSAFSNNTQQTKTATLELTGAEDGSSWIGIYSNGNRGNTALGAGDVVIDNVRITPLEEINMGPAPDPVKVPLHDDKEPVDPSHPDKPVDSDDKEPVDPSHPDKPVDSDDKGSESLDSVHDKTADRKKPTNQKSALAKTGDISNIWGLLAFAGIATSLAGTYYKRRR